MCTKAVASLAALQLVDREMLDLDANVSRYWPEFAQQGKDRITVRQLLGHQAGLAVLDEELTPELLADYQRQITDAGIPLAWPKTG